MNKYSVIPAPEGLSLVDIPDRLLNDKTELCRTPIVGFCVEVSTETGASYSTPVLINGKPVSYPWIVFNEKTQHWYADEESGCAEESLYRTLNKRFSMKKHIQEKLRNE